MLFFMVMGENDYILPPSSFARFSKEASDYLYMVANSFNI
jgi:hypothetical protein